MDMVNIVETIASFGMIRINKVTGNWYTMYCPFHSGGQEKKPSFGISLQEEVRNGRKYPQGSCHCFACGYFKTLPDMMSDILQSQSVSKSGYDWLVENIPGFEQSTEFDSLLPPSILSQTFSNFAIDYIQAKVKSITTELVSEEELERYRFTVPYMYERKLTDAVIDKFDVGYDGDWIPPGKTKKVPCITFPVHDKQGHTLFICRRSIAGKMYNYPTGVSKPVYGLDMIPDGCKSVIIVESIINALTAWTYGYVAVALMGTGNSLQLQQLRELGVSEYVLCMDGDEAGRRAATKLKRNLQKNALIWTIQMPDGKDLNDCSKQEFDSLYSQRE